MTMIMQQEEWSTGKRTEDETPKTEEPRGTAGREDSLYEEGKYYELNYDDWTGIVVKIIDVSEEE